MHSAGTQNVGAPVGVASGAAVETAQPSPAVGSINVGKSPDFFESRGRGRGRGLGDPVSNTAEMRARGGGRGKISTAGLSRGSKGKQKGASETPGRRWRRRAGPGQAHQARSLRSAPPPPARSLTAPRLAARGAEWLRMGQTRHPGCSGLSAQPLRPRPALAVRLRGPGLLTPSAAAPRRTGRPAGRRLPQRPPGSRGSARLGAGREGAGPARREGAFKVTHTPPSAQSRAREPGGLATLGSGLDWAPAGLEES